jgi:hypothetical protein
VDTHVVELGLHHTQTRLDFAQTATVSQLGEGHDAELFGAFVRADLVVAVVAVDACLKASPRNEVHELRENEIPFVHNMPRSPSEVKIGYPISNRSRSFSFATR